MRKKYFDAIGKFEPFAALYEQGADPNSIKAAIVQLLNPYVDDGSRLREHAVDGLAGEAIAIAKLSTKAEWKAILDECFGVRRAAIAADDVRAFQIAAAFEEQVLEAQHSYGLLVTFEAEKSDFSLDEYAFEMFRSLGVLIESNIQTYAKELYCLHLVATGSPVDIQAVMATELGRVCEALEQSLPGSALLTPSPWGVRVNQWRNIAQHHGFRVEGDRIIVRFGKMRPQKEASLSRKELLEVARGVVWRNGAMKASRAITHFNFAGRLRPYLPAPGNHRFNDATALASSIATQGFRLLALEQTDGGIQADIEDVAPCNGHVRPIHCSQFVAVIADFWPGRSVRILYRENGVHTWTFYASKEDLEPIMTLDNPLKQLAETIVFDRVAQPESKDTGAKG